MEWLDVLSYNIVSFNCYKLTKKKNSNEKVRIYIIFCEWNYINTSNAISCVFEDNANRDLIDSNEDMWSFLFQGLYIEIIRT